MRGVVHETRNRRLYGALALDSSEDFIRLDQPDTGLAEVAERRGAGLWVHRARGVHHDEHVDLREEAARIEGAPAHAVIERQSCDVELGDTARAKQAVEASGVPARVVAESRIAVRHGVHPFPDQGL